MSARPKRVRTDYLCGVRFRHLIPPPVDLPFDLRWNPDLERITDNDRTLLTFRSKHLPLFDDLDLDLSSFPSAFLEENDACLVVPPKDRVNGSTGLGLKRHSNDPKSWLRMTQYISASESVHKGGNKDKTMESRMATLKVNRKKLEQSHEEQITKIEESFKFANDPNFLKKLKHPKNSEAEPIEILSIFPEFEYKHVMVVQASFDTDPWEGFPSEDDEVRGERENNRQKRIKKSLINPVVSGDEKFLMLYVPNLETAEKLSNIRTYSNDNYRYKWVRDYETDKNQIKKNSQLLFMERYDDDDHPNEKIMVYVPFSVRWNMKRKRHTGKYRVPENYGKKTFLNYSYKAPANDEECQAESLRNEGLLEEEIESILAKRRRIEHPRL
ncbi:5217_t:CDS:2 [Dentiscutata erythropus]|uniref:5217_t:CDS:1 n=1 Tax=Dentiscutata erythropus TaxID=1348616 RepID=A0A9N9FMT9_9GLOM|nr:5217_t:CDS:2 [Dentiscutata erythropus]